MLMLMLASAVLAQSALLDYEHRVVRAAEQIDRIKTDSGYAEEGVPYIKRLLPKSEKVKFETKVVDVDNAWLWALLDDYSKERDKQQQVALLNEAGGRLRALDQNLLQAEAQAPAVDRRADQEKLREILARREYQPENETALGRFIKKALAKLYALLNKIREAFLSLIERVFGVGSGGGIVSKLIVIGVLGIALVIALRMISRVRPRKRRAKKRVVLGEEVEIDATPRDLADAAMDAARAGDFRSAIRKLYVSLLYDLAERRLIELEDSATNHEYLSRVSKHRSLIPPMRFLTDRFDYVWYGMFPSSEEDFANCLTRYREAVTNAQALGEQRA
jgi:hypothetical protein